MINKKTKFCKAAALLGAAVMMISALAGCGKNTKVVLTAGLKKNEVFRISSASCVLPEVMVYLTNMQNQYESVYGSQIWNASDGQLSLEQEEREQVLTQLARIKVMNLLAQKKEVTLDDKEKERAAAAGRGYFTSLNSAEVTALNVTQDLITKMYEEYALAEKVYQTIVENVNPEVSDDEARTITVDMIRVSDSAKASQVLGKAKEEGVDFETLAQAESEDQTVMQSFGKGEVSEELEKAAFNLGKDEISDVVESDGSYYILKCISTFDEAQTKANKEKIVKQRQSEAFDTEYTAFEQTLVRQLNEELWNSVTMIHQDDVKTSSFFEVYQMYFQHQE
mgnify:FL=1